MSEERNDLVPKSIAAKMAEWRAAARAWKPHDYQGNSLRLLLENPQFGLLLPPGMGKTSISLALLKILKQKRMFKRSLVVAPIRACENTWPAELSDWTDFHDLGVALLHGADKDRRLRSLGPEHDVCLINPEGVPWLTSKAANMKLLGADTLIIDESSLWKSSTTVRFRALRKYLKTFKRRHILTGSPRPRNYLDLHGQVFIMDLGCALGEYVTTYRNNFFFPTGYQMREWELLPGADKKIDKLVAPLVHRLDARDYLRLPKELEQTHRVELPPAARKEYDRIEKSLLSTLFDAPMVSSASARSKCAQIANGAVYLDDEPEDGWGRARNRQFKTVHTAKTDALAELVAELQGEPVLVGIGYRHDVEGIRKALGYDVPCINGATTRGQAAEYIERWNKGLLPVLLAHPASAGHALNLQKFNAQHVAYFDIPDNYDLYDQFFLRVCRQGNKAPYVIKHHFVTIATVDVPKMRNLRTKATGQNAFLAAMREYSKNREAAV